MLTPWMRHEAAYYISRVCGHIVGEVPAPTGPPETVEEAADHALYALQTLVHMTPCLEGHVLMKALERQAERGAPRGTHVQS